MADQLVTPAQVKARIEVTDANDDSLIVELIEQVTDWIQEYTGRKLIAAADQTYVIDTAPGSVIDFPLGIRNVDSLGVALADQPDAGGSYTSIDAADILLRPTLLDRKPGWPATSIVIRGTSARLGQGYLNGARVVGDVGFLTVPPEIQAIAIDAVALAFYNRQAGSSDVIGADDSPMTPWARYFTAGSAQMRTLGRYRAAGGDVGIA